MAKDPAFLFYPGDWHLGTMTMSRHLKGCYMDLLVAQFNSGSLSLEEIRTVLGNDFASWGTLSKKFAQDAAGKFFNERLQAEKLKRAAFVSKQTDNGKKGGRPKNPNHNPNHNPNLTQTQTNNENENENENLNGIGNGIRGVQGGERELKLPTVTDCEVFFQSCGRTREEGEYFFYHYERQGWKTGNDIKVTNWASLAKTWVLNPKEKNNGTATGKIRNIDGSVNWTEVDKSANDFLSKSGLIGEGN